MTSIVVVETMDLINDCIVRFSDVFSAGDSANNEWRRQTTAYDTNPMYQLIYMAGKGRLVEAYEKRDPRDSDAEFRKELRKAVTGFVYNDGEGKLITKVEFARFRKHLGAGAKVSENNVTKGVYKSVIFIKILWFPI